MSTLPQQNARLHLIESPGRQVSYGHTATDGPEKWSGDVAAYVDEALVTRLSNGTLDRVKKTTLIIPGDLRPPVALGAGDHVTFEYAGQEMERKVLSVIAAIGPAGTRRTVRLELEESSG